LLSGLSPGQTLLADRAYDSDALRSRRLGQHQAARQTGEQASLQPLPVSLQDLVERFFNKLKHFRAVATRYEKHASNYLALIKLAATRIWLRGRPRALKARLRGSIARRLALTRVGQPIRMPRRESRGTVW
jgi:hypothetical protein